MTTSLVNDKSKSARLCMDFSWVQQFPVILFCVLLGHAVPKDSVTLSQPLLKCWQELLSLADSS